MKDKLRELAEEMRISGELGTQSQREITEYFASKLDAILDAEGDGGAVWWTTKDGAEPITSAKKAHMVSLGYPASSSASHYEVPLYAHPARSGVVSEEDVRMARKAYNRAVVLNGSDPDYWIRAAIELDRQRRTP